MIIVGIDEVGRGCWAGPLVAGAVVFNDPIQGLKDSKKLSIKQRQKLAIDINLMADAVGLGWVSAQEVDQIGLTAAVKLAMSRALELISIEYDQVIIDGNINYLEQIPKTIAVIKADDTVPSVSAASIVAKVARDQYMAEQADKYPVYGFEKHVGYGTSMHLEQLKQHGVCELHRRSFKPIQALVQ